MKIYRGIAKNNPMLELEVDIHYFKDYVEAASILDLNDPAFYDFEMDVLEACEIHDFKLEDSYKSNDPNSMSLYYIYVKTNEEGTRLKIFLKIRISDHNPPSWKVGDTEVVTYNDRDKAYMANQAKEYAEKHFKQPRGYRIRRINIVFNDEFYTSYGDALIAIEDELDRFDPE